ncbi:flavodoxin domain-containing protein [Corynebacterium uropygiale]|uniref:Flavodoxin domain-containing protein n=1 Tax=Corynebacterium uropygiale TaxID=1775911 RepID=A0A9X1QS90_9CORY|nr:flavodoxin domain-containing protein [Corynebacterium uropygiale]MCF4006838.1 flavodoxin domain-containing protein [Corynebacterium uropygiale]
MTLVLYHSWYGSTRRYAEELAGRLGARLLPLEEAGDHPAAEGEAIIVLSAVHGPVMPAADYVRRRPDLVRRHPVAVVNVGMTLLEEARAKDPLSRVLGEAAEKVRRFYLPGRMAYSELSAKHRVVMRSIIAALKAKPQKGPNERAMIENYGRDVDWMDMAELDPIVEWCKEAQQAT